MRVDPLQAKQAVILGVFAALTAAALWYTSRKQVVEDNRTAFERYYQRRSQAK